MKILLLLLLPFLIAQCSSTESPSQISERKFSDAGEARRAFESSTITCATGDCPEFIGGLYTFSEEFLSYTVASCSATLISADRVLTNRHCIPADIRYKGALCTHKINIYLPETLGLPAMRHQCEQVEMISGSDETLGPDWAIIKLKTTSNRKVVNLNRDGVPEDSIVNLYKINFDLFLDKPSRGEVLKTKCIANSNHFFARNFIGSQSVVTNVSDCDNTVIKGNSGAGIFNENLELIGILSFNHSVDEDVSSIVRQAPGIKQTSGGGTNLACIKFDSFNPSKSCEFNAKEYELYATIYSIFKAQRSDDSFNFDQQLLKTSDSEFIKMTKKVTQQNLDNFDIRYLGSMRDVRKIVAHEVLSALFLEIPECVVKDSPQSFKFDMSIRELEGDEKVDELFFRTIESRLQTISVRASKLNSDFFELSFLGVVGEQMSRTVFNVSNFSSLKYKIPVCND